MLEIRHHYTTLDFIGREIYSLHMMLMNEFNEHEWKVRQEKVVTVANHKTFMKKKRLKWKYQKLAEEQKRVHAPERGRDERLKFITNKSKQILSEEEEELLKNGLKYQPKPEEPPLKDIVAAVETAIKYLPIETKAFIRDGVATVLERNNNLKTRHNKGEYKIITNLQQSRLVFLEPDKGKGTVILESDDYRSAALTHLNEGPYKKTTFRAKFPVDSLQRKVKGGLRELLRKGLINEHDTRKLTVDNPVVPSFSLFPKTHKNGNKIRPVISNVNTPTSKISEWLVKKLRTLKPPESLSVKNSFEMASGMNGMIINENEVMVSFDVEALFPSIPLEEAFSMCKGWISGQDISDDEAELIVGLMNIVLDQRIFEFNGEYYTQLEGLFIGNNLSSIITEVFLGGIEMRIKQSMWFPKNWQRYVDDVLCVVNRDEVENALKELNLVHPAMKFTHELESDDSLPFLDTRLIRNDGRIEIDIYRKPTDAPLCIPKSSHHHYAHKFATFESNIFRMSNLPLSDARRAKELKYLRHMATINGFKEEVVNNINQKHKNKHDLSRITTLKPLERKRKLTTTDYNGKEITRIAVMPFYSPLTFKIESVLKKKKINVCYSNRGKLKNILGNGKNKRPKEEQAGIYEIPCEDCEQKYIGQTKRRIEIREKEHENAIKNRQIEKSSVSRHCNGAGHKKGDIKLIRKVENHMQLDAYESMYIANSDRLMNTGEPPIVSKLFDFTS